MAQPLSFPRLSTTLRRLGVACALAAGLGTPVAAQAPDLAMLDGLQPGAWTLTLRGGETSRICVRNGREFIQMRHRQPPCERFVVHDRADEVTVQYTCRGNGYGRTTIRREGPGLVQVRSQGIHGGSPFSIVGEARRTGGC